ncbi:hypothetical protein D3C87_1913160 [compost metagenome]
MLEIEPIAGDHSTDAARLAVLHHELVSGEEQRRMDIWQPSGEPVGREWQHALGRRDPAQLFVKPDQAIARERGPGFQHLQARAQPDQLNGKLGLLGIL